MAVDRQALRIAKAQLVETALLNLVSFQTAVASKAARCRLVAAGAQLLDFAMRRCQGLDAAVAVARCSALVGFAATSNTAAPRHFGLPAAGTMAHSYVEAFADEPAAFRAFAEDFPDQATFLVDTYDTLGGCGRGSWPAAGWQRTPSPRWSTPAPDRCLRRVPQPPGRPPHAALVHGSVRIRRARWTHRLASWWWSGAGDAGAGRDGRRVKWNATAVSTRRRLGSGRARVEVSRRWPVGRCRRAG